MITLNKDTATQYVKDHFLDMGETITVSTVHNNRSSWFSLKIDMIDVRFTFNHGPDTTTLYCMSVWIKDGELYGEW